MKIKDIPIPESTRFRTLQVMGTILTVIGLFGAAVYLAFTMYSFFVSEGMNASLLTSLFAVAWAIPFIVVGQLMHWLVAMWEGQNQIIRLLEELRDK